MMNPGPERALSREQRVAIAEWIELMQPLMRLQDWDIKVIADPSDRDSFGETTMRESYHEASIAYSAWGLIEDPKDARRTLVHELVHLLHGDYAEAMADAVAPAEDHVKAAVMNTFTRYNERFVESVARILADNFELPSIDPILAAPGTNDLLPNE